MIITINIIFINTGNCLFITPVYESSAKVVNMYRGKILIITLFTTSKVMLLVSFNNLFQVSDFDHTTPRPRITDVTRAVHHWH